MQDTFAVHVLQPKYGLYTALDWSTATDWTTEQSDYQHPTGRHLDGEFPTCVLWDLPFVLVNEVMDRSFAGKLCDNMYVGLRCKRAMLH